MLEKDYKHGSLLETHIHDAAELRKRRARREGAISNREVESKISILKKEFKSDIESAVSEGWLPQSALGNLYRIDSVQVVENFSPEKDEFFEEHGASLNGGVIELSTDVLKKDDQSLKEVLYHEFLHEISGTSIVSISGRLDKRKIGLSFGNRFDWINEATTQYLTNRLLKNDGNKYYVKYVNELNKLIAQGLDLNILYAAYFENITRFQQPKNKAGKFKTLVQHLGTLKKNLLPKVENLLSLEKRLIENNGLLGKFKNVASKNLNDLELQEGQSVYQVIFKYGKDKVKANGKTYFVLTDPELENLKKILRQIEDADSAFKFGISKHKLQF